MAKAFKKPTKKDGSPRKNNAGRPPAVTEQVLKKLRHAFMCGLSNEHACFYAGISEPTFYEYCHLNPEFSKWKDMAKNSPVINAKMRIAEAVRNGKMNECKWLLERKAKEEYSLRSELTGADGGAITIVDDIPKEDE